MVTPLISGLLCILLMVTIPSSEGMGGFRFRREAAEEKASTPAETSYPEDAVTLRAISLVFSVFGSEFNDRIEQIQTKIVAFYTTELIAKKECKWTDDDQKKWKGKLAAIKLRLQNDTEMSMGLSEFQARDNLTEPAKWTLGILEEMENFTTSIVEAQAMDIVLLKYSAYLREKMIMRRAKNPGCTWKKEDQKKAGKTFSAITEQLATDIVNGVAKQLQLKPEEIISDVEMENFKKELHPLTQIFNALFEPFEED